MWSPSSTDAGRRRIAATLLVVGLAGCTTVEGGDASGAGTVEVGEVEVDLDDTECAELDGGLHAGGAARGSGEVDLVVVDVTLDGGDAEATVRRLAGDEVVSQQIGTELAATVDGDDVRVEGTLTGFEGTEQTGDVEGRLELTCGDDRDPGGGLLSLGGREVGYEVVTCVESDDHYELRARSVSAPDEQVTLSRTRLRTGWRDRLTVAGSVTASTDGASEGATAVEATGGLFSVRGTRVTAEGAVFGDDRLGFFEATCGIDLSVVRGD